MSKLPDDGDPWAPNNLLTPEQKKYVSKRECFERSEYLRLFGSVVRALNLSPGDPGSNPIRDVGFFTNYASFLLDEFSYSYDRRIVLIELHVCDHYFFII